jgi:hypothetical protein
MTAFLQTALATIASEVIQENSIITLCGSGEGTSQIKPKLSAHHGRCFLERVYASKKLKLSNLPK